MSSLIEERDLAMVHARPLPRLIAAGLEEKSERFCRNGGAKWISRGN